MKTFQWRHKLRHDMHMLVDDSNSGDAVYIHHRIYSADINSAYIYACSLLPNLATGRWHRVLGRNIDRGNLASFGIYHIRYNAGIDATKDNHKRGAFEEIHPLFHAR